VSQSSNTTMDNQLGAVLRLAQERNALAEELHRAKEEIAAWKECAAKKGWDVAPQTQASKELSESPGTPWLMDAESIERWLEENQKD